MSLGLSYRISALLFVTVGTSFACQADESALDKVFPCDVERGDAQCGTDENGEAMTCYVGSAKLGGKAFCTKRCNPKEPVEAGFECSKARALLQSCNPDSTDNSCPSPLNCYRTDLLRGKGVCLWVPICPYLPNSAELDRRQCSSPHSSCASDL